ncbi:hypothetical protein BDZ97DRAFT_1768292 [Flammula alnicola]|nr:hypothetical protein BDZ97DRAFT_1768292 [Flammula alnicola]
MNAKIVLILHFAISLACPSCASDSLPLALALRADWYASGEGAGYDSWAPRPNDGGEAEVLNTLLHERGKCSRHKDLGKRRCYGKQRHEGGLPRTWCCCYSPGSDKRELLWNLRAIEEGKGEEETKERRIMM